MKVIWKIVVCVLKFTIYVRCVEEKENNKSELPEALQGNDINAEDVKKLLDDKDATVPGFDKVMMDKFRQMMDHVATFGDDNDATVDRYNTPEFPTIGAELEEKYMGITDITKVTGRLTHIMVNDLIVKGHLKSARLVKVMREVDKEEFAPMDPLKKGHYDYPIDLGYGTWMEPPHIIAGSLEYMKRLLKQGSKVLEIGAGTGYMTSLLVLLGGKVTAIEHVPELANRILDNVREGSPRAHFLHNVEVVCADGRNGYPKNGPYDVIYISASFPEIPFEIVKHQLKDNGRMIFTSHRDRVDKHVLTVYYKFANRSDECDAIHGHVYLPPLQDLHTQLYNTSYPYNASRPLRPERWFTGDYEQCYFDRNSDQRETRMFESEYDNPTVHVTPLGMRSPLWWNFPENVTFFK